MKEQTEKEALIRFYIINHGKITTKKRLLQNISQKDRLFKFKIKFQFENCKISMSYLFGFTYKPRKILGLTLMEIICLYQMYFQAVAVTEKYTFI